MRFQTCIAGIAIIASVFTASDSSGTSIPSPGTVRDGVTTSTTQDDWWRTYYTSITNGEIGYGAVGFHDASDLQERFSAQLSGHIIANDTDYLLTYGVMLLGSAASDTNLSDSARFDLCAEAKAQLALAAATNPIARAHLAWAAYKGYAQEPDPKAAEALNRGALLLLSTNDPPSVRADILSNLAVSLKAQHIYNQAIMAGNEELTLRDQVLHAKTQDAFVGHHRMLMSCIQLADTYQTTGRPVEALHCYTQALPCAQYVEFEIGNELSLTPNVLGAIAGLYAYGLNDFEHAATYYNRRLVLQVERFGATSPQVAECHLDIAMLHALRAVDTNHIVVPDFSAAEESINEARSIQEVEYGTNSLEVARCIRTLGVVMGLKGRYSTDALIQSESLLSESLTIQEGILGPTSELLVNDLTGLASVKGELGRYRDAGHLLLRAQDLLNSPGADASSSLLNAFGALAWQQGDYNAAIGYYTRFADVSAKTFGADHPITLGTFNNLGTLNAMIGRFGAASDILNRVLDSRQTSGSTDNNPETFASTLHRLGCVYGMRGEHHKACQYFEQALALFSTNSLTLHPEVAALLMDMGESFAFRGDYSNATACVQRALAIRENIRLSSSVEVADCLRALGRLCAHKGDYVSAVNYCSLALSNTIAVCGNNHPKVAEALRDIAEVLDAQGNIAEAIEYQTRALEICRRTLGPTHSDSARSLGALAVDHFAAGDSSQAMECAIAAAGACTAIFGDEFSFLSGRQRLVFNSEMGQPYLDVLLSLATIDSTDPYHATESASQWVLRTKGLVLASLMSERDALVRVPAAQPILNELRTVRTEHTQLLFAGKWLQAVETNSPTAARIMTLGDRIEELERELGRLAAPLRGRQRLLGVTSMDLLSALPASHVLVDLIRFEPVATRFQRENGTATATSRWRLPPEYAAIVWKSRSDGPRVFRLGRCDVIDDLVHRCQAAMRNGVPATGLLTELYNLTWAPIAHAAAGHSRVIISPDGELNFLPFAALLTTNGTYLCEEFDIGYVTCARDIVRSGCDSTTNPPSLFGDPEFGQKETSSGYLDRRVTFRSVFDDSDRTAFGLVGFPPLPGTRAEVEALGVVLAADQKPAQVYLGGAATEGQLKALDRPEILHLATHGFFLPDVNASPAPSFPMAIAELGGFGRASVPSMQQPPMRIDNPMHRSGLAFSGAALATAASADEGALDDGILTAEEASSLRLWGTSLVVLSACDTGMGETKAGQGVMGLRRAFAQAGVRNLLMTLWPVEDEATGKLMIDFYRKYLETGDAIASITEVQRGAITAARRVGRKSQPRVWAPFLVTIQGLDGAE